MRRAVARLYTGYCLLTLSFHFSFHDLRLDIGDWLQHSNHLIVLYAVTFVITFIPRLEASVFVELKQLWAICLTLHQHQFSPDYRLRRAQLIETGILADLLDFVVANQFATLLWELRRAFDSDCLAALTVLAQNAFRSFSVANTCALATSEPKLTDFTGRASIRTKALAAFASSQ